MIIGLGFASGKYFLPASSDTQPYALDYRRIAINIPITHSHFLADKTYALGEKYLAESLSKAFQKEGYVAAVYTLQDTYAERYPSSGYEFYMRAYPELEPEFYHRVFDDDRISVLFETIPYQLSEVQNADIVFTGSLKRYHYYRELGVNAYFMPQFTSFDDFYPALDETKQTDVLYIANQWPKHPIRKTIQYALEAGVKLDVYGENWEKILVGEAAKYWKAPQVPNDQLKYYYSSAKIVLNDMRDDMIEAGFISNRVFDVTACQGFLISQYSAEIEEIYGDAIPMYRSAEEFKSLIDYYLRHPEERKTKAFQAYQITKQRFGREQIVRDMLRYMEDFRRKKALGVQKDAQ